MAFSCHRITRTANSVSSTPFKDWKQANADEARSLVAVVEEARSSVHDMQPRQRQHRSMAFVGPPTTFESMGTKSKTAKQVPHDVATRAATRQPDPGQCNDAPQNVTRSQRSMTLPNMSYEDPVPKAQSYNELFHEMYVNLTEAQKLNAWKW